MSMKSIPMSTALRVLITDDELDAAEWLRSVLEARGVDVRIAADARTAEVLTRVWQPDVVLLDLMLGDVDGLTVLPRLRAGAGAPHVIIVSGRATVRVTVAALAAGAMDVLEKPVEVPRLHQLLARAAAERRDATLPRDRVTQLGRLVTIDPAMRELCSTVRHAAPTSVNVLIQGENGTGKELVAAALHELSPRAQGPFVKVNCAALPAGLLESELFGHARGAFTGAVTGRKGLFEMANGGSILLDEIAEMPLPLQAKLLRVLQEREIRPVGSTTAVKADFRLICATNVDAAPAVAEGRLRQDLYFRLNTIAVHVPPLRARPADVPLLATRFLETFRGRYNCPVDGFTEAAMQRLQEHEWPGNVRELEHVVERAVILAVGSRIGENDLPREVRADRARPAAEVTVPAGCSLEEVERLAILQTLELTDWNKRQAARILGIHRPTLYNKLRKYRLWRQEDRFRREPAESLG